MPALLARSGYHSTLIGLQHESRDPATLGFDEVVVYDTEKAYCGPVADQAVAWLDTAPAKPFFLTVGFFETHRPYPSDLYDADEPTAVEVPPYLPDNHHTRDDLAAFHGSIRAADAATGRIIDAIDRNGLADTTLVIFTTDHGVAFPRAKGTLYDPGIRIALLVRPPATWHGAPAVVDQLVSHVDVLPTLLDLTGTDTPPSVQGSSFASLLRGQNTPRREEIFAEKNYHDTYDPMRCIRTERYKYIRNLEPGPLLELAGDIERSATRRGIGDAHLQPRPAEELYDLHADRQEQHNLAGSPGHADIQAHLAERLDAWMHDTNDPILHGPIIEPQAAQISGPRL